MTAKRLQHSTSPYLQQHADNPVDWWPWCDEALALARRDGRPILLSVGYSACHWCHVMAHESFEDPETAALMNRLFVNIKVDREERPDLDKIYQIAHQLLARRPGGWPLTAFLSPEDQTPFFAGTYFPPQARHGLPAFRDLLQQVAGAFVDQRAAIDEQNGSLRGALAQLDQAPDGRGEPVDTALFSTATQLAGQFDVEYGGFGGAPKFPHPATLRFLLRHAGRHGDETARHVVVHTLENMANGGINDHLGGGFCRYAVDAQWMIPHFEKMLYDNGQLLALYADAWWGCGRRPLFRHVCERIAEWVMREMQSPLGGYFASLDADSEGEEGRYYVWTPEQVAELLDADEYPVFAARYGLDRAANFEGRWHLHIATDSPTLAADTGQSERDVRRLLASARTKLFRERERRLRPGRDEKILTSWNALMIKGMARAGRLLQRDDWLDSAEAALRFLYDTHFHDGRLLATSRDGAAQFNAYLDDYAYLVDAILELLQARWDARYLAFAVRMANRLLQHFEDRERGGFYFTSDDHETLVHRTRPLADDAMPSGNGVAIEALQTLAVLAGDARLQAAADRALRAAWPAIEQSGYAHVGLLEGLQGYLAPNEVLIVSGHESELAAWRDALRDHHSPGGYLFFVPMDAPDLPPALAAKRLRDGQTAAFRCRGNRCEPPCTDPAEL